MIKKFVSNKDESPVIFQNPLFEKLSKVYWFVPLLIYTPIISFLIITNIPNSKNGLISAVVYVIFGLIFWTLTEYLLHRFVFHYHPRSNIGKRIHWTFHGVHHDYPNDSLRLVMPPSVSLPLSALFYFVFSLTIPFPSNRLFFSGFMIGYLAYDTMHYAFHHFTFRNKILLALKSHHMKHHYQDPDKGYGVSSAIWDIIFKTDYSKKNNTKVA